MQELFAFQAVCSVAPTVGPLADFVLNQGFRAAVSLHTAPGNYDLTVDDPINASQCTILTTLRGAGRAQISVEHVSDLVKRVRVRNEGGFTDDFGFDLAILRKPGT